ncbi:nuclear transport factor 2 family protein [Humibacter antri]
MSERTSPNADATEQGPEAGSIISLNDYRFGPNARNRTQEMNDPSASGAVAALETFYYALNQRDAEAMAAVWSRDGLAQLNNPVGGILRGGENAVAFYARIFASGMHLEVTFGDAITYLHPGSAVFAGTETGTYSASDAPTAPLKIRTSRFFGFDGNAGRWAQLHHHGSIDDVAALRAYQLAVTRG